MGTQTQHRGSGQDRALLRMQSARGEGNHHCHSGGVSGGANPNLGVFGGGSRETRSLIKRTVSFDWRTPIDNRYHLYYNLFLLCLIE